MQRRVNSCLRLTTDSSQGCGTHLWDPGTQGTLSTSLQAHGATNSSSLLLEDVQKHEENQPYAGGREAMSESCDGTKIPRKASGGPP